MRGSFFAVAAAALCLLSSCDGEVTLRLLTPSTGNSSGDGNALAGAESGGTGAAPDGGGGAAPTGGVAGTSGAVGDAGTGTSAGAGDGGDMPPPCDRKLGAEVCNGADDNCDGAIDEGCAFTIKWADVSPGPGLGKAGALATDFGQPCPRGSLLVGIHVGMGTRLDQVLAVCQQFELSLDPTTHTPTSISFTSATPLMASFTPDMSKETDTRTELPCPPGLFVTGLNGTTTAADPQYTQRVQIDCSPLVIANNVLSADSTKTQSLKAVTCTGCSATAATLDVERPVPAGQVASGLFGRDGVWVDFVGLSTATARVQPR